MEERGTKVSGWKDTSRIDVFFTFPVKPVFSYLRGSLECSVYDMFLKFSSFLMCSTKPSKYAVRKHVE